MNNEHSYCNKKNNLKKDRQVSISITMDRSKSDKRNLNKINKNFLMTLKKNIPLYESNDYLSNKGINSCSEKNKSLEMTNPKDRLSTFEKKTKKEKSKIYKLYLDLDTGFLNNDFLLIEEEANLNLETINLNSDFKDIFKKCTLVRDKEYGVIEQNKQDIINTMNIMKEYISCLKVKQFSEKFLFNLAFPFNFTQSNFKDSEKILRNTIEEYKCKVKELEVNIKYLSKVQKQNFC